MTHDAKDPARLAVSVDDPLLADLLRAGEAELGTQEQLAAVAAKLGPILGSGGGAGGAGGGGAGSVGGIIKPASTLVAGTAGKVLGVLAIGAVVALAGGYSAWRAPGAADDAAKPVARAPRPPTPPTPDHTSSDEVSPPGSPAPLSALPTTPRARPLGSSPTMHATSPPARAVPVESTAPSSTVPAEAVTVPAEAVESEVRILQRAQDALRVAPSRSLSICEEHASRFPNGLLSQEREVMAIDALTRLGRTDEATTRARRFRSAHPSSSHLGRIEVLVGRSF